MQDIVSSVGDLDGFDLTEFYSLSHLNALEVFLFSFVWLVSDDVVTYTNA